MFTFRTSITCAVMAFILTLAALLIAIQVRSLRLATRKAAAAYMDATSSKVFGRLHSELSTIVSLVRVLATMKIDNEPYYKEVLEQYPIPGVS